MNTKTHGMWCHFYIPFLADTNKGGVLLEIRGFNFVMKSFLFRAFPILRYISTQNPNASLSYAFDVIFPCTKIRKKMTILIKMRNIFTLYITCNEKVNKRDTFN